MEDAMTDAGETGLRTGMRTLRDDTLVVFVSDTHIGGDPGHDIFESPEELAALLKKLSDHDGPVELVLAGDFFDFLEIGGVPVGENRASVTISRPEYRELFYALRSFAGDDGRQVVYLPGNHDAEAWWNGEIRTTLREEGLVEELALSYAACFESVPDRAIYCEHGNQSDPANAITDYDDALDTPFGEHIVADVVYRIVPRGRITKNFDLREVSKVFPLATIPQWIAGRVFYELLGRVATCLLLPLLAGYAAYRVVAYLLATTYDGSASLDLWDSYRTLPGLHVLFGEIAWDAALLAVAFAFFFIAVRRAANRTLSSLTSQAPGERRGASGSDSSLEDIKDLLTSDEHPPMSRDIRGKEIGVFVSGHTHVPSLTQLPMENNDAMIVNSGCWLRQLRSVPARFGGPPVFVSEFVQTHARVYFDGSGIRAELWEHPKPAPRRLRTTERLAILGRLPAQCAAGTEPRLSVSGRLSRDR